MKKLVAAIVLLVIGTLSPSLSAQWPAYPTPDVPKTAAGQPDLSAPAPRTADGKPDLSGIWEVQRSVSQVQRPPGAPFTPPLGTNQFWDIGTGLKEPVPYQPWARELWQKRISEHSKDNPDAHCLPLGIMQLHTHPQPRKIIQTPKVLVILYEANAGMRQIFTDGRPLPNNDPQPWWFGYSTGRWEGDTLVVESAGFIEDGWLDVNGSPLTNAGKLIERFRRVNYGTLEIDVTIDDPKAYTKPFSTKVAQRVMLDTELIEFVCQENEKFSEKVR